MPGDAAARGRGRPRHGRHHPLHLGHHRPSEGRRLDAPRGALGAARLRLPRRGERGDGRGRARSEQRMPDELHPGGAALPRHRLRAGDALLLRGRLQARDDAQVGSRARARADRARARDAVRRRADAVAGTCSSARTSRGATPRAWRHVGGGGAPAPPELVRRVDRSFSRRAAGHRLRHDRDQRLRPGQRRRRLPAQAHELRPRGADRRAARDRRRRAACSARTRSARSGSAGRT